MTAHRSPLPSEADARDRVGVSRDMGTVRSAPADLVNKDVRWLHWIMIACCAPVIAVAVGLVVTGYAGIGAVVIVVGCVVMMSVMSVAMGHGDRR